LEYLVLLLCKEDASIHEIAGANRRQAANNSHQYILERFSRGNAIVRAGELVTDRYRVYNIPTEFIVDINGIIRYRDGVPEYLAAHLPDLLMPYVPSKAAAALVCTP
jgi:hypothetical protein